MGSKLDKLLDSFQKDYKMKIADPRSAGVIERLVLDSPGLNYAFGGGLPLGRMLYIQGPESGGKSTLATYLATQVQQKYDKKRTVVYLDYEYSFDTIHAEEMGLNVDENFIIIRPNNAEDGFNMIKELADSGEVGMIIVDSITTMASKSAMEDAFGGFAGSKTAIAISQGLRMVNPYLYNNLCTLVVISQERANVGVMYGPDFKGTGGKAPAFYSSWSARVTRTGDITDKQKGLIGIEMKVRNTKNKVGIAKREANLKLYFSDGIHSDDEYFDYLKALDLITQKGPYYYNDEWENDSTGEIGMKVCGIDAVKEWLHNNPIQYEKVKKQINEIITGHVEMDNEISDDLEENEDGEIIYENMDPES